jgi:hypothetical protein
MTSFTWKSFSNDTSMRTKGADNRGFSVSESDCGHSETSEHEHNWPVSKWSQFDRVKLNPRTISKWSQFALENQCSLHAQWISQFDIILKRSNWYHSISIINMPYNVVKLITFWSTNCWTWFVSVFLRSLACTSNNLSISLRSIWRMISNWHNKLTAIWLCYQFDTSLWRHFDFLSFFAQSDRCRTDLNLQWTSKW